MLFGKRAYQLTAEETALEALFTNTEHLRQLFEEFVTAQNLPKRLLIIHGVGGGGKSTLLKMFRLFCKKQAIPVGFVSVDEAKTGVEMLTGLSDELGKSGVKLPEFSVAFQRYQAIQAKVEEKLRAGQSKLANAGKASAKVALETAATAVLGPLGSVVGGMSAEALTDWLFGFLTKPDVDFYLNPLKLLTQQFVADLAKTAAKKRVTLMFDTYEQIGTLDDWVRELARAAHGNILFVIATRSFRGEAWERDWPGCLMQARFEELRPMEDEHLRDVISRYYQAMRGATPDPAQVEAVVKFSRGLPLVATTAARLWAAYDHTDFQTIKAQVAADLVDRLLESVPKTIERLVEAAAALRWFDQSVLRAVLETEIPAADFKELRQFPFTRPMREGKLALHDVVRDVLDENLKIHDPARHKQWHERAAAYFEQAMPQASLTEQELFGLERLYHRIRANEESGMQIFRDMAEELWRYDIRTRLETLLNDVNTYGVKQEHNVLWWQYYHANLLLLKSNIKEAESLYQELLEKTQDSYLRAKILLNLVQILRRVERLFQPGIFQRSLSALNECERLLPDNAPEWFMCSLLKAAIRLRQPNTFDYIETTMRQVIRGCKETENYYGLTIATNYLKGFYALHGRWQAFLTLEETIANIPLISSTPLLKAKIFDAWQLVRVWMGQYSEAERLGREVIDIEVRMRRYEKKDVFHRDLILAIAMQKRMNEVLAMFEKEVRRCRTIGGEVAYDLAGILAFWGWAALHNGELQLAYDCLCESEQILQAKNFPVGVHETHYWLGYCCLAKGELDKAEESFSKYSKFPKAEFSYFQSGAFVGFTYIKYAQGKLTEIPDLIAEAETLAQQYEYNEHIAALHLLQGHLLWQEEPDAAFDFYQQALIYALRFNRFCLDEILFGDNTPTPYQPLIPFCLQRGEDGRNTLRRLKAFWQTGANDVGQPRPDTISPIPENISLLDAERLAREREPGDGSPQMPVIERIESHLTARRSW